MERSLKSYILDDLPTKIVLLSGPRQTGKTTLSKQIYSEFEYFNYDSTEDRLFIQEKSWNRDTKLVVFDELHKMKQWKRWLKGIYDTQSIPPEILITGSAKLNVHSNVGDSLAGRYFQYRLHPLDLKEICQQLSVLPEQGFETLWHCSGFPEPFLRGEQTYYKRWRTTHTDIILRQDLIDLSSVRDIHAIQNLVMLLRNRAGGTVSYANLARDLERDPNTIKRWLELLENLYVIYRVTPYSKNITRSLLKEPKFYFYDHALIDDDQGARLENVVANALKKELHYLEDTQGVSSSLHFLRTKDGKEIDFLVVLENKPALMIEVKMSDDSLAKAFDHFSTFLGDIKRVQLVKNLRREKTYPNGVAVKDLVNWLSVINLKE